MSRCLAAFLAALLYASSALAQAPPGPAVLLYQSNTDGTFSPFIPASAAVSLTLPPGPGVVAWGQNADGTYSPLSSTGGGGSGTVTSVICGTGLTGGTITVSGTCSISAGAITNAMLAGSITAAKLVGTDIATVGALTAGSIGSGFGSIATANPISTSNSTASSSTATGAVTVAGGLGVGGAIYGTTLNLSGNLTTNVTGSTQCLHASSAGVVSGTGSDCGAGGGGSGVGVQAGQSPTNIGDNATALVAAHYYYELNAALTAARIKNLPDSATQGAGDIAIHDAVAAGGVTASNTIQFCAAGTDKLNGTTNGCTAAIATPYFWLALHNDGAGSWWSGPGSTIAASTGAANQFATGLTAAGLTYAQPAFSNLSGAATVAQIGGSAASHGVPVDVAGTSTYKVIPDCPTVAGTQTLNYTQSTDAFSCGTIAAASGALTFISTQTASNSDIQFTGLTGSDYVMRCRAIKAGTASTTTQIQFGTGGTPTWVATGYKWEAQSMRGDSGVVTASDSLNSDVTGIDLYFPSLSPSTIPAALTVNIYSLNASAPAQLTGEMAYNQANTSTQYISTNFAGTDTATTARTAIRLHNAGTNAIASGSCSLYSVQIS